MQKAVLKRALAIVVILAVAVGYVFYRYREQTIDHLYAEAAGLSPAFRGTRQAQAATKRLGTYRGARSKQMLLNIALGRTPIVWPDVQREAIEALMSRNDTGISVIFAGILQPYQPLPTRQAAAQALRSLPCTGECVKSILHYLERVLQGEPNYEDRTRLAAGLDEGIKADVKKDQQALYETLYEVLKREARATLDVLVQVHGLGTDAPSKFSLALVSDMQFREACPLVLRSDALAKRSSADSFLAPREELQLTLRSLRCQ